MQDLTEPYEGVAQGLEMRYGLRIYRMADEQARAAEVGGRSRSEWTAPDAPPVRLADLPLGEQDKGIEVMGVMEAIALNRNEVYIVNTTNNGAIPNLPADAVVEVPGAGQPQRHPSAAGGPAARRARGASDARTATRRG